MLHATVGSPVLFYGETRLIAAIAEVLQPLEKPREFLAETRSDTTEHLLCFLFE